MLYRDPTHAERELIDLVERGAKTPSGRTAVHLHLSQLMPVHRPPQYLRIAARLFAPMESDAGLRVFSMSNGDIMIVGREMPEEEIDRMIQRIKSLFSHDPLTWSDPDDEDGFDPFVTWYAFEVDLEELRQVIRGLLAEAEKRRRDLLKAPPHAQDLTPEKLNTVLDGLGKINIRHHLRRQPCVRVMDRKAVILFEEIYTSMADLRKAVAPETDLFSARWLFQDFSRSLDRVVLTGLPRAEVVQAPRRISLNLNLETVETREYQLLRQILGPKPMVLEVQLIDVFTNLAKYLKIRDQLRADGDAILIDSLTPAMLGALDMRQLDPDFVKIQWSSDLAAPGHPSSGDDLGDIVEALGGDRVILTRCDTELAITWGLTHGIYTFQGRFMDAILGTVSINTLPQLTGVSLRDFVRWRTAVDNATRHQCPDPRALDAVQEFASPPRRGRAARAPVSPTGTGGH